jgi:hypothetical protein
MTSGGCAKASKFQNGRRGNHGLFFHSVRIMSGRIRASSECGSASSSKKNPQGRDLSGLIGENEIQKAFFGRSNDQSLRSPSIMLRRRLRARRFGIASPLRRFATPSPTRGEVEESQFSACT